MCSAQGIEQKNELSRTRRSIIWTVIVLVGLAMLCTCFAWMLAGIRVEEDWSKGAIADSRLRGDRIRESLQEYFDKNQRYPPELTDLTPDFIAEIPEPLVGDRAWRYRYRDNDPRTFELFVISPAGQSDNVLHWIQVPEGMFSDDRGSGWWVSDPASGL